MTSYIGAELRRLVIDRAERLCEYCLIHEDDTFFGCQVDHIISEKHGGPTEVHNLALACTFCNRYKGSDIGSIIWETNTFVRFYTNSRCTYSISSSAQVAHKRARQIVMLHRQGEMVLQPPY